ncbi:VIT1/CCC1 transporter family protein [Patescibacteria group bacterium]
MKDKYVDFIHNKESRFFDNTKEIIFGVEDGIVSTLGALTGIAIATGDQFVVIVSGLVIISVESISMGVGSYISNKSVKEIGERKLSEERMEVEELNEEERIELQGMYEKGGWSLELASDMAEFASKNNDLMLREMSYRELGIFPGKREGELFSGVIMFLSYVVGGFVPLVGYVFLPMSFAILCSITLSAFGLFLLGSFVSRYTNVLWWKVGSRILLLGGIATLIGFLMGSLAETFK